MRAMFGFAAVAVAFATAGSAFAADESVESRLGRVEQRLEQASAPSSREIQSAVDAYLASAKSDATLVGGPGGSAGYDGGFWIRGGSFLLKVNLTVQTRFEAFRWDDEGDEAVPGGDLSGFSLPRVTLKFSGDATCDVHYYAELEFGHAFSGVSNSTSGPAGVIGPNFSNAGVAREAWIEYESSPALVFRMGLLKTAATRQLMTAPELQQFVDIGLASAYIGGELPGYTDRNRDYGIMLHGVIGCDGGWSYLITVTNGDGPATRNVLDRGSNDNLAYSARVNWDIKGHIGYEEGALHQHDCEWLLSAGAWVYAYTDIFTDKPHRSDGDILAWGVDAAAGYGGWTFTGAYNAFDRSNSDFTLTDGTGWSWFAQVGYLFPDTAWEVAARYGWYTHKFDGGATSGSSEIGAAINYYVDGHSDKLTLDAAWLTGEESGKFQVFDAYAVYGSVGDGNTAILLRFQWQLAL